MIYECYCEKQIYYLESSFILSYNDCIKEYVFVVFLLHSAARILVFVR